MKAFILGAAMLAGVALTAQTTTEKKANIQEQVSRKAKAVTPEERIESKVKNLTTQLNLDEKQQNEVRKVYANVEAERQKILDENKANRSAGIKLTEDQKRERKIKVLQNQNAVSGEFKKIFTAEQFTKYEQLQQVRKLGSTKVRNKEVKTTQE